MYPLIGDVGTPELLIIFAVVMLVFGGSKLPDLARGSGRAIRIFKEEVGRTGDDEDASPESATDGADDSATARPGDPTG
jgi:sec-independent protein translocase protein TatA